MWTEDCPLVCGHDHPVDDTPPADINIDSTPPTANTSMDRIDPLLIPPDVDDEYIVHQLCAINYDYSGTSILVTYILIVLPRCMRLLMASPRFLL
jgi:hypothetical protein